MHDASVFHPGQSRQAALWALRAVVAWMAAAAVTLFLRRLAGACGVPPTASVLIGAAATAVGFSIAVRLAARALAHAQRDRLALEVAISGAVWLLAAALSAPGAPASTLAVLWLMALAEEGWAWSVLLGARQPETPQVAPRSALGTLAVADEAAVELEEAILPEGVCQQLTRSETEGVDTLTALVRVCFAQGARTANAHLAFCPPFAAVPECEAEALDGVECRVKAAQILPYGVRLECKLSEAAEEACEAVVRIEVRSQELGVRIS